MVIKAEKEGSRITEQKVHEWPNTDTTFFIGK